MTTGTLASGASTGAAGARLVGWPLVGWCTLAILAVEAAILALEGTGESGLRMVIRASARIAVVLFCAAFVASSWFRLRRDAASRFLLVNRRYVGVSFAVAHFSHLAAIVALARAAPDFRLETPTLVVGGIGYLFVAAMTATSFDRTAAWLGSRRWRRLHLVGGWWIWLVFALSYLPRAAVEPSAPSVAAAALVLATAAARIAARRRRA